MFFKELHKKDASFYKNLESQLKLSKLAHDTAKSAADAEKAKHDAEIAELQKDHLKYQIQLTRMKIRVFYLLLVIGVVTTIIRVGEPVVEMFKWLISKL
jgi:hypothetical protein